MGLNQVTDKYKRKLLIVLLIFHIQTRGKLKSNSCFYLHVTNVDEHFWRYFLAKYFSSVENSLFRPLAHF